MNSTRSAPNHVLGFSLKEGASVLDIDATRLRRLLPEDRFEELAQALLHHEATPACRGFDRWFSRGGGLRSMPPWIRNHLDQCVLCSLRLLQRRFRRPHHLLFILEPQIDRAVERMYEEMD